MHKKRFQRLVGQRWIALPLLVLGIGLLISGLALFAVIQTTRVLAYTKLGQFEAASNAAKQATPIVTVLDLVTFSVIPDLEAWRIILKIPTQLTSLTSNGQAVISSFASESDAHGLQELKQPLNEFSDSIITLNSLLPQTWLLAKAAPEETLSVLAALPDHLHNLNSVISSLSDNKQTWVFVFQNSNELRATGGFPGSYGLLELTDGKLSNLVIEDIYDADGQFQGYVTPPAGIKEYTSGSRGLRLPDANWWPDFPTSARTMLQFFAFGEKQDISGVVMVNLETAKALLKVTGPLYLPDYNTAVSENNIDEVLRAERDTFFPGSKQKKHILDQTISQLKNKLSQLHPDEQYELGLLLLDQLKRKEIQLYSNKPEVQELLTAYGVSGAVGAEVFRHSAEVQLCSCEPVMVMLVESNVGINKVNKYVQRSVELSFESSYATVSATFRNDAAPMTDTELSALLQTKHPEQRPRNGNGYLNYYRLLISPEYEVSTITIGGTQVTSWDDELITTSTGERLRQVGVLIGITEQQNNTVSFSLRSSKTLTPEVILIPKQSGLQPSTYLIKTPTYSQEFQLTRDSVISFQ